jgi:hypothetical protein
VPESRQLSRPEVGGGTCLHSNDARRQAPEEADELTSAELTADQNLSVLINTVDLEDVLGEIETNSRDLHRNGSLFGAEAITLPEGHCREQAPSTPPIMGLGCRRTSYTPSLTNPDTPPAAASVCQRH